MTWNFSGNVISTTVVTTPSVNPAFSATDAYGDNICNLNNAAFLVVPAPAAPTNVKASQVGDEFEVSWQPNKAAPAAITSSTITATPVGSTNPVLSAIVSGSASTGLVGPLQPSTTYHITAVSTTIGGASPASSPIAVTTVPASIAPSAPTGVSAHWASTEPAGTTDTLVATWNAAVPGNSPIDEYEVNILDSDSGTTLRQTVFGTKLTASFTVDFTPNWTVTVRASNVVGWGPVSAGYTLGGL